MELMSLEQNMFPNSDDCNNDSANQDSAPAIHVDDVQRMEARLLKLLDEFNAGKSSFGNELSLLFSKNQEELMRLHFEQDRKMMSILETGSTLARRPVRALLTDEGRKTTKANIDALVTRLESLSYAIHNLHYANRPRS
ncbi:Coiled-coil domain-containing protein 28B, variant 2 [Schistosoma haematobium]|uniref:Coiled-coil domain-containing protein 28B, variant 2 n=1 Tax=Schistosoma haematobium TaxID=6185 RepID=A0A922LPG2_SCHHA|nr:Coiled-coil domain-containing protein 28B, variant 2 [Schistosoma haematobium]KAH9590948.1 Coiled-coil domain-containing protein 28B, variant 2 [Schistosoma haematobium]